MTITPWSITGQGLRSAGGFGGGATHELDDDAQLPDAILHERTLLPVVPAGLADEAPIVAEGPIFAEFPTDPEQDEPLPLHETLVAGHPVTVAEPVPATTPAGYLFPAASTPAA